MKIAKFLLAVDRISKDNDEADFIRCTEFGKNAEFAVKYLKKGMKITVVGQLSTSTYEDKNGDKAYSYDVIINENYFCEKKSDGDEGKKSTKSTKKSTKEEPELDWE